MAAVPSTPVGFPGAMPTGRGSSGLAVNEKEPFLRDDYVPVVPAPQTSIAARLGGLVISSTDAALTILAPAVNPLAKAYGRFDAWKEQLDLGYPGQVDQVGREAKNVHLTNYIFDGAKADLSKSLNMNPAFQVTHSFTLGASQPSPMGGPSTPGGPGTYNFNAVYATNRVLMTGGVDHEGSVNARFNYAWSDADTTKIQASIQPSPTAPSMIQLEHDRTGRDYSLNLKAYNPGVVDGTGVFMASYLQALTKRLAVGSEVIYQRPNTEIEEANMSYMAKYVGGAERDWIATAQLLGGQGVVQGTYWQRLSDRVEAGAEITLAPHPSPRERKASATLAAKYDFRLASLRAQLDSSGKVSAYLEQRFTPAFSFLITGEIDHVKNTSKWGVGIQLESSTMDEAEAHAQAQQAASSGFKPPV